MTRTTRRFLLAGLTATLFAAAVPVAALLARPGTIVTKDGNTITGEIIEEKSDSIIVDVRGIRTTVQRDNIQSFDYTDKSVEAEFKERFAKLGPRDVAGRIELARWAFDKGKYMLARDALESALTVDPNSREATELLENVRGQMRLEERAAANPPAPRMPVTTGPSGVEGEEPTDRNLLTAEQVNIIKQVELQPGDTQARINIPANVRREYVEQQNLNPRAFNSLPLLEQALDILQNGDEQQRRSVRILNDPASMLDYRRNANIQQTLLVNCATSGCHGPGTAAGGFLLFNPADNDTTAYTNFYILQKHVKQAPEQAGAFARGELRMIDRARPEQSLLVQYMLPPTIAEHDHPQVPGYRPVFRNREDAGYQRTIDWIGRSLEPIEPDYGIDYKPPVGRSATTEPAATQPAEPEPSAPTQQPRQQQQPPRRQQQR